MHDRRERVALGDEPPRLGDGDAGASAVERAPCCLAALLDVSALRLGPGEEEFGFVRLCSRGVGVRSQGLCMRPRRVVRALEHGEPLLDLGKNPLGGCQHVLGGEHLSVLRLQQPARSVLLGCGGFERSRRARGERRGLGLGGSRRPIGFDGDRELVIEAAEVFAGVRCSLDRAGLGAGGTLGLRPPRHALLRRGRACRLAGRHAAPRW